MIKKKILAFIKVIKIFFWCCVRVARRNRLLDLAYIMLDSYLHKKKLIHIKVDSVEHYCEDHPSDKIVEIEPKKSRPVYEPPYFELSDGKEYQFISPSIYVAFLHNVNALGATGWILTDEGFLCDALKYDEEHRIDFRYGPIMRTEHEKAWVETNQDVLEIEKAINLCGIASTNYYHFTIEILSRLGYVNQLAEADGIPVLIDEEIRMYPQFEQLLKAINPNRKVVYVPHGTCVKAGLLVQPSMNTWMPCNVTSRELFGVSDNLIAKSGLMNIRSCVQQYLKEQTSRKIFISRKNSHTLRVANENKIIPLFEAAGFEIVFTETLSYVEQIELFSTAKCVVGASGAALTNILYCHPGTVVGCIIPREYDFCIYSTMAYLLGCNLLFFNPDITYRGTCMGEDNYRIDEEQCHKYIQEIIKMCI